MSISNIDKDTLYSTFADMVQEKLSNLIIGNVTCTIVNSYLCATINPNSSIKWYYTFRHFDEAVSAGMTSKDFAENIAKEYKKYILNYFFK